MHETSKVGFKALINVLYLPIGLWVVRRTEAEFQASRVKKELLELTRKYHIAVRYDGPGQTMQAEDRIHE
jgi:hypothetical protein